MRRRWRGVIDKALALQSSSECPVCLSTLPRGGALSVMSQGELNALALSLFLPRMERMSAVLHGRGGAQ